MRSCRVQSTSPGMAARIKRVWCARVAWSSRVGVLGAAPDADWTSRPSEAHGAPGRPIEGLGRHEIRPRSQWRDLGKAHRVRRPPESGGASVTRMWNGDHSVYRRGTSALVVPRVYLSSLLLARGTPTLPPLRDDGAGIRAGWPLRGASHRIRHQPRITGFFCTSTIGTRGDLGRGWAEE